MGTRRRTALALICALALIGLVVPASTARATAVPKVYGLSAAGVYMSAAKLGVKWRKVTGASYQVRWASSTGALSKAKVYATTKTSAISPALPNVCLTWYAQVRAKKSGKFGAWSTAKALKFGIKPPTSTDIATANFAGAGVLNGVKFTWNPVAKATRYQVEWDAAPFGKFTPTTTELVGPGWITQRTATLTLGSIPQAGDRMMGAAYGNPVYARLVANNKCFPNNTPRTPWIPVFPGALTPGLGDSLRFGTYNLELTPSNAKVEQDGPARISAFASNIAARDLDVLVLQEASSATVTDLIAALALAGESDWAAVPPAANSQQQILYRGMKYSVTGNGTFGQAAPPSAAVPLVTPWARLHSLAPDDGNERQDVFVVSPHLAQDFDGRLDSNTSLPDPVEQRANKTNAGLASTVLLNGIKNENVDNLPVIAAGDLKYLREPFQDVAGEVEGPPTFTRGLGPGEGFYDAINSKNAPQGAQFTTVNGHAAQTPQVYGVATRSDYIFLKGFQGSLNYVNVANQAYPAVNWQSSDYPSDHNLLFADVVVPFK